VRQPAQEQFFEKCELGRRQRPVKLQVQAEPGETQGMCQQQFRVEPGFPE
jgi:hypothetical protein